jgi:hypothetical protein
MAYRDAAPSGETVVVHESFTWMCLVVAGAAIAIAIVIGVVRHSAVPPLVVTAVVVGLGISMVSRAIRFDLSYTFATDILRNELSFARRTLVGRVKSKTFPLSDIERVEVAASDEEGRVVLRIGGGQLEIFAGHLVTCREIAEVVERLVARASEQYRSTT